MFRPQLVCSIMIHFMRYTQHPVLNKKFQVHVLHNNNSSWTKSLTLQPQTCTFFSYWKAFLDKSIHHMAGDILNEIWQCPPQWVWMVYNSLEFVGEGRWVIFNSHEPPPPARARVKPTPFGRGCKYLIHCTYISDEVLWTCSQRRSDTLNKTNRKTEKLLFVFWI